MFQNGVRSRKKPPEESCRGLATPKPPGSATALVMTPADHSPCEKAVAALTRRPGTMVWCNVGSAHKMIPGLHLFAFLFVWSNDETPI